jgi:hypothetical protein
MACVIAWGYNLTMLSYLAQTRLASITEVFANTAVYTVILTVVATAAALYIMLPKLIEHLISSLTKSLTNAGALEQKLAALEERIKLQETDAEAFVGRFTDKINESEEMRSRLGESIEAATAKDNALQNMLAVAAGSNIDPAKVQSLLATISEVDKSGGIIAALAGLQLVQMGIERVFHKAGNNGFFVYHLVKFDQWYEGAPNVIAWIVNERSNPPGAHGLKLHTADETVFTFDVIPFYQKGVENFIDVDVAWIAVGKPDAEGPAKANRRKFVAFEQILSPLRAERRS